MLYQLLGLAMQLFYEFFLYECTIQMERNSTKSLPYLDKTAV